jgi:putative two-component system response regulator
VLVVDDDAQVCTSVLRLLDKGGYDCLTASSAAGAEAILARESLDLLLCDVELPGDSGLELVARVSRERPEVAAVMISGHYDQDLVDAALGVGAYGYLTKPFRRNDIVIGVANALHRRDLEQVDREHRDSLESLVEERTVALQSALSRLEETVTQVALSRELILERLSQAARYRDEDTGGHIERMSLYCELLARAFHLDSDSIRLASPMHDVGKIAVRDAILLKPGTLTPAERTEMELHCEVGYNLLSGSGSELLDLAATMALTHHERVDGTGYPNRLAGDQIPLVGRLAAVADVFDALTSDRVYRPAFEVEQALEIMSEGRGTQFDSEVLDTFLAASDEVQAIKNQNERCPDSDCRRREGPSRTARNQSFGTRVAAEGRVGPGAPSHENVEV